MRYPAGLDIQKPYALSCDEELYVLAGSMHIGDLQFVPGDYAYLPAGMLRHAVRSDAGCDVLTFYEGRLEIQTTAAAEHGEVVHLCTADMEWGSASDSKVAATNVGRKLLRPDTPLGERTWLLRIETQGRRYPLDGVETHPCVEEMFLIKGDIAMTTGVLRSGAYFWRPPGIPHGPMGTREGFLALFRAKEGAFETSWSEPEIDVPWNATYAPILPDSLSVDSQYDSSLPY